MRLDDDNDVVVHVHSCYLFHEYNIRSCALGGAMQKNTKGEYISFGFFCCIRGGGPHTVFLTFKLRLETLPSMSQHFVIVADRTAIS